jgi:SAM-dependent methyltransferase
MNSELNVKESVLDRYSEGAKEVQPALCCPVDYDTELLKILPKEIVERDYGCGDPSRYVCEGEVVLDLGSGGGKICYMAAQIVGKQGKVIGVDMNDDMLGLARSFQNEMAEKLGADLVDFRKGHIQDLALDVEAMEAFVKANPVGNLDSLDKLNHWKTEQGQDKPLVESNSVDIVVSNCVLNLVAEKDRRQMIDEIFRVLKPGGRVAISDIIADEYVPKHLKNDSELWSGCISGAFQEEEFLNAFLEAGFISVAYDKWDSEPWQVVEGFEFRSATIVAQKPIAEDCKSSDSLGEIDARQALIYKGPFAVVMDDQGNQFEKGLRVAVSERVFNEVTQGELAENFIAIPGASCCKKAFDLPEGSLRSAKESKGVAHTVLSKKTGKENSQQGGCC